jgi:hypothetical protein
MRAHPAGGTTMVARLQGGHWKTVTTSPMTTRWDYAVSPFGRMAGASSRPSGRARRSCQRSEGSHAAPVALRRVAVAVHHDRMELQIEHPEFTAWPRLVGTWSVEASHPLLPGEEIRGTAAFEWLPDQHFLVMRGRYEHPEIPDALTVTGIVDGAPAMHYFDPRGEHRTFAVSLTEAGWRYWNDDPSFAQRFTGTFADRDLITGRAERSEDNGHTWELDLEISYRRVPVPG